MQMFSDWEEFEIEMKELKKKTNQAPFIFHIAKAPKQD